MRVIGIDGAGRHGWVGVIVDDSGFVDARTGSLGELVEWAEPVQVIGIDIPIGQVAGDVRQADVEARRLLRGARASVFAAPPNDVLAVDEYHQANELLASRGAPKMSRQAWALVPRVIEAAELAAGDDRVHEVHPEVCFHTMAGQPLEWPKKSWNGLARRHLLLEEAGISLPAVLPDAGGVPSDDIVDAAAAAWTARRIAAGVARSLPEHPEAPIGPACSGAGGVAIWV